MVENDSCDKKGIKVKLWRYRRDKGYDEELVIYTLDPMKMLQVDNYHVEERLGGDR